MRRFHQLLGAVIVAAGFVAASPGQAANASGSNTLGLANTATNTGEAAKFAGTSSKSRQTAHKTTKGKSRFVRRSKTRRDGHALKSKKITRT
jgi:hypothetical protein